MIHQHLPQNEENQQQRKKEKVPDDDYAEEPPSQAKGRGRRRKIVDDDDNPLDTPSQQAVQRGNKRQKNQSSQAPASQSATKSSITDEEKAKLVSDLMRYILFMDGAKHPVSRTDIIAKVLKDYKDKKITTQILEEAKAKFKYIFGYELIELPKAEAKGKKKTSTTSTGGSLILKNTILPEIRDKLIPFEEKQTEMGLIMILVGVIEISGRPIDEDTLFSLLKMVGFNDSELHPTFGDWKKLIENKITKELKYLTRSKSDKMGKNDQFLYEYKLGPRALIEIDRRSIRTFLSQVFGENVLDSLEEKELELEEAEVEDESNPTQSQE